MEHYIVVYNCKFHIGINQRKALKLVEDMRQLHRVFFEKFTPRGHVEK